MILFLIVLFQKHSHDEYYKIIIQNMFKKLHKIDQ